MNEVINLKKKKMIFEKKSLRLVILLDPTDEARYTKLVRDDESNHEMDCIYQIIAQD